jgi:hypothetical protein
MNKLYIVVILLVIVYVVYTYINKKASKCYHCEVRKDKLLRAFMLKSACRKKYEKQDGYIPQFVGGAFSIIGTPLPVKSKDFEDFARLGGCNEVDTTNTFNLPQGAFNLPQGAQS